MDPVEMTTEVMSGKMVSVAGYPADKGGYLYEHTGPVVSVCKTKLDGYIIAYNVDTTPGN